MFCFVFLVGMGLQLGTKGMLLLILRPMRISGHSNAKMLMEIFYHAGMVAEKND